MKLKKISLLEDTDFRSLPVNFSIEFSSQTINAIDPRCIVGLNGSGKSNLLELIAEIFYHIEMNVLYDYQIESDKFAFEIEYTFPLLFGDPHLKADGTFRVGDNKDIKVTKERVGGLKFFIKSSSDDESAYIRVTDDIELLVPKKIIGYSSGQNELLSNPFLKMRFQYVEKMRSMTESKRSYDISRSRFFWMDYENNKSIVIANLLLGTKQNRRLLIDEIGIFCIESFKLIIDLSLSERKLELSKEVLENIEKLKSCTPFWYETKQGKKIVLEYKVNKQVIKAFHFHFVNSQKLFEVLYQLELLNLYMHKTELVKNILNDTNKEFNVSEQTPYNPDKRIVKLNDIKIKKFLDRSDLHNTKIIKYKNLSDGEHQFLQIFGSIMMLSEQGNLFLLDEPETHFNPMWRSKMVKYFNIISINKEKMTKQKDAQEILLTTHSPFILSDSQERNIFRFSKIDGKVQYVNGKEIGIISYGASVGLLLERYFGQETSMGDFSYEQLRKVVEQINSLEEISKAERELLKFGESVEKFDIYYMLQRKKKELFV